MEGFITWWQGAIVFGTVIMCGALGEILTQKSGHLNLGVPGEVYLGGFAGFAGAFLYENSTTNPNTFLLIIIPILCAILAAGLAGLVYSFFTVTLKANQNVTGLALTYIGVGIGSFGGQYITAKSGSTGYARAQITSDVFTESIHHLTGSSDNWFLRLFFSFGFMIYLVIILAVVLHVVLKKTRVGLNLRAVGESPATADAAGINVSLYKYVATIVGGAIAGIGGLVYIIIYNNGGWSTTNSIETLGWLAVALVIFATWKPANTIWGSYLFAFLFWFYANANVVGINLSVTQADLVQALPYFATIVVLIIIALRKKKENQPPASLGVNYFREER